MSGEPGCLRVMASGRMEMRQSPECSLSRLAAKVPASMLRAVFAAEPDAFAWMRLVSPRNSATNFDFGFR